MDTAPTTESNGLFSSESNKLIFKSIKLSKIFCVKLLFISSVISCSGGKKHPDEDGAQVDFNWLSVFHDDNVHPLSCHHTRGVNTQNLIYF